MNRAELIEIVRRGENSGVEFKRDDITKDSLAKEIAALLNLEGGYILLGVEDDQTVSGVTGDAQRREEWVMQVAGELVHPGLNPFWETLEWEPGVTVGVIALPADAPDKPYKIKRSGALVTPIRSGTITRFATREEEQRLYQRGGWLRYGLKPVPGANLDDLNRLLLRDFLTRVQGGEAPGDEQVIEWEQLLRNLDLATPAAGRIVPTVDGMLLFGRNPGRFLPQSGLRAICYTGTEPDYAVRGDETIKGPLVPLGSSTVPVIEPGLVDRGWDFVRRHTMPDAWLEGPRRQERWEYPEEVLREILVNALVHRDYSITGTDVLLTIFSDRLEIQSPGRLPNTVTTDGMKLGHRYARNQTLANLMRDYGYVDGRGMGIRNKVIPGMMNHNGTEPDLIPEEFRFTVRLWKDRP